MHLTTYTDPAAFLADVRPTLESQEAFNNLILGIAARLINGESSDPPPFMATVGGDQPSLIVLMTPPFAPVVYGADLERGDAFDIVVAHLAASAYSVPGVLGPVDHARAFAQSWQRLVGQPHRTAMNLRVYQLTEVSHRGQTPGFLRPVQTPDLDLASKWCSAFYVEVGEGASADPDKRRQHVQRHIDQGTLFAWENDGQLVSMAARTRPTARGEVINDVYTPPDLRGRGYASACVAALSQRLLDEGKHFCALFADLANPTSNSIYQKMGYVALGDFVRFAFEPAPNGDNGA